MIEIINKYKDLEKISESLLLIDKYDYLFKKINNFKKYNK